MKETDESKAQEMLDSLSEEDYKKYKAISSAEKTKTTKQNKSKVFDKYKEIQILLSENKEDEARTILDEMTDEEYKAYQSWKKSLE